MGGIREGRHCAVVHIVESYMGDKGRFRDVQARGSEIENGVPVRDLKWGIVAIRSIDGSVSPNECNTLLPNLSLFICVFVIIKSLHMI